MNNSQENKKLNDKGFSLVELIIVIAIMAVLVGVLAPQYLQYVEKSRQSADATTINEFVDAMTVLASDVDAALDTSKTYTVSNTADTTGATLAISSDLSGNTVFATYMDVSATYTLKSTLFKDADITLKLEYKNDMWQVTQTGVPTI